MYKFSVCSPSDSSNHSDRLDRLRALRERFKKGPPRQHFWGHRHHRHRHFYLSCFLAPYVLCLPTHVFAPATDEGSNAGGSEGGGKPARLLHLHRETALCRLDRRPRATSATGGGALQGEGTRQKSISLSIGGSSTSHLDTNDNNMLFPFASSVTSCSLVENSSVFSVRAITIREHRSQSEHSQRRSLWIDPSMCMKRS